MGYYLYNDGHNNILIKLNGKTLATLNQLNLSYDLIEITKLFGIKLMKLLKELLKSKPK